MSTTGTCKFRINDLSMEWTEDSRRKEKACIECGMPTRGRMVNGGGTSKPAHLSCAMTHTTNQALRVYGAKKENS